MAPEVYDIKDFLQIGGTDVGEKVKHTISENQSYNESGQIDIHVSTYIPVPEGGTGSEKIISYPWVSSIKPAYITMSTKAQKIARSPFAKAILQELTWMRDNQVPGTAEIAPKAYRLFTLIQDYTERRFSDPFSSYLNALFDGLCSDDRWADIDQKGYAQIEEITRHLASQRLDDYHKVDKAIMQLEALGINTTPYGFED